MMATTDAATKDHTVRSDSAEDSGS
ncbi:MAG: hypothetical protein QOC85_3514, partial [Streptomyces sp.]|nr:hypothetical protein [Streptomyces sp.]